MILTSLANDAGPVVRKDETHNLPLTTCYLPHATYLVLVSTIDSPFGMVVLSGGADSGAKSTQKPNFGTCGPIIIHIYIYIYIYLIPEYETLDSNVENELII